MPKITQAERIKRKNRIDPEQRTPDRDIVADFIEQEIMAEWPVPLVEIAERTAELEQAPDDGYSRQHIKNTLDTQFHVVDDGQESTIQTERSITIPEDVESESYIRGWLAGRQE